MNNNIFDKRIRAAFFSQAVRVMAGIATLAVIASFPSPAQISDWYLLQGAAGLVMLVDCGFSAFVGCGCAGADQFKRDAMAAICLKIGIVVGLLGLGCSTFIFFQLTANSSSVPPVAAMLIAIGCVAALWATFLQALLQGAGLVAETLFLNAIVQSVVLLLSVILLVLRLSNLTTLSAAWAIGNLTWLVLLIGRQLRRPIVSPQFNYSAKRLWDQYKLTIVSFVSSHWLNVAASKLVYLFLGLSIDAVYFAKFGFSLNTIVALASVLSFAMNGALIEALPALKTQQKGLSAWSKLTKRALTTVVLLLGSAALACGFSAIPEIKDGIGQKLLHTGMLMVLSLSVILETFASWWRPISQLGGRIIGPVINFILIFAPIALGVTTGSLWCYIIARLVTSCVSVVFEFYLAKKTVWQWRSGSSGFTPIENSEILS